MSRKGRGGGEEVSQTHLANTIATESPFRHSKSSAFTSTTRSTSKVVPLQCNRFTITKQQNKGQQERERREIEIKSKGNR